MEQCFGNEHPNKLIARGYLALKLKFNGKLRTAADLETNSLEGSITALGRDHPETLTGLKKLVRTLLAKGKLASAVRMMEECLELRVTLLGAEREFIVDSANALARWKRRQERGNV